MPVDTSAIIPVNSNGKENRRSITVSVDDAMLGAILGRQQDWQLPFIGHVAKRLIETGLAQSTPGAQKNEIGKVQMWQVQWTPQELLIRLPMNWMNTAEKFWVGLSPKYNGWREDLPFPVKGSVELAGGYLFWM